ncbi:hypothetical protein Salat_2085700 [Sesamum alatum]|uniref:Uncharacterized protein n=1 Tax=Sesamum alatum TaxID=300844 RepID=A0AAE2CGL8_9LAMI|nr:hypothetical protein Salat_2085700 [Sesamum alatum]
MSRTKQPTLRDFNHHKGFRHHKGYCTKLSHEEDDIKISGAIEQEEETEAAIEEGEAEAAFWRRRTKRVVAAPRIWRRGVSKTQKIEETPNYINPRIFGFGRVGSDGWAEASGPSDLSNRKRYEEMMNKVLALHKAYPLPLSAHSRKVSSYCGAGNVVAGAEIAQIGK